VAGSFVHDLAALSPGTLGEFTLNFKFGELGVVVRVGDGAGAEAVTDTEGNVVGGADVADVVPVFVEKAFASVVDAPFGHDRAASGDDARHAFGGVRDEAEEDASMDCEVVDTLFGLFDEGVAEEFPSEVFDLAVYFLKGLINRDGTDGDRRVAEDPFAGGVDVLSGREIHNGVTAPFGGPAHFFDFFVDGRGDGGVADVGVDFDEEVTPDDHGL